MRRLLICLCLATSGSAAVAAENEFVMPGFDVTAALADPAEDISAWKQQLSYEAAVDSAGAMLSHRLGWRLQWEGLSSANNYWVIDGKLRVYDQNDAQYNATTALDYDAKLHSLYLQKSFARQSLQLGYQSIGLGVMDMLGIVDVLTPWDYSEAAFTSPEDARIGQPILYWRHFSAGRQWDLMLNLYPDSNRYPGANLRAILEQTLGTTNFVLNDGRPAPGEEPELLLRQRTSADRHEYQWLLGSLLQNDPGLLTLTPLSLYSTTYPRFGFAGASYSYTRGNHQWKAELAYKQGLQPIDALGATLDEGSLGLGWEYSANGDYTLALEAGHNRRWLQAGGSDSAEQYMLRWSRAWLHDTVNLTLFAGQTDPGNVRLLSTSLSYTPMDDWVLELNANYVESDNSLFNVFTSSIGGRISYYW